MSAKCLFCEIVNGSVRASVVHRDTLCTCFMDIQPVNPGHILIVPNDHATYLNDLPEATGGHLFVMAQRLSTVLRHAHVRCDGVNLFLADGEAAMQEILHVHLHVFPRYRGDGFGLKFGPHYMTRPERSELDTIAQYVAQALGTMDG